MKKICNQYTGHDISMFIDNELGKEQSRAFSQHLSLCPDCQQKVAQMSSLSIAFNRHADEYVEGIDHEGFKRRLEQVRPDSTASVDPAPGKTAHDNIFGFLGKNSYLKLSAIAVALVISLIPLQKGLFSTQGPSAIVQSIDTDFTNVMIIETEKKKHTIIWFSET